MKELQTRQYDVERFGRTVCPYLRFEPQGPPETAGALHTKSDCDMSTVHWPLTGGDYRTKDKKEGKENRKLSRK
jgi:hypothetical protein